MCFRCLRGKGAVFCLAIIRFYMIGIEVLRRTRTMAGMCIGLALTLLGGAPSFYILVHSRSASPQYNTHTHTHSLTHTHTPTH